VDFFSVAEMPTFFFHLATPRQLIVDDEGIELANLEEARETAAESAKRLIADALEEGGDVDGYAFNVTDETGQPVLIFEFKPLLDGGGG
jgi:hypothetical protein